MGSIRLDKWQIKVCLARKRMTRTELCRLTGISQGNMTAMLKRGSVSPKTAGLIADALGVDVEEILVPPEEFEREGEE